MNNKFDAYIDEILKDVPEANKLQPEILKSLTHLYNKNKEKGLNDEEAFNETLKHFGANYTVGHLLRLHDLKKEYQKLVGREDVRIRRGILAIIIVPIIFLILMFTLEQKIVFLILWIGFIIGIATYLILIEYRKYRYEEEIRKWEEIDEKYI